MKGLEEHTMQSILLVEDDHEIARLLTLLFTSEGFQVQHIDHGDAALDAIRTQQPDLVILDIMLPGLNGIEVCRQSREFYHGAILMLTACEDDITEVSSLNLGADDYLVKPIRPHVLLAHIHSLFRRTQAPAPTDTHMLKAGHLSINTRRRESYLEGALLDLTDAEYELLVLLIQHAGTVVSRHFCFEQLRGIQYEATDRSVDMRLSTLRKKLHTPSSNIQIKTVRGKGYILVSPS